MNQPPPRTIDTWAEKFFPGTTVHKDWYTDPNIPTPWSTDWDNWEGLCLFHESVDGKLKIDKLFKEVYDVPGAIEPLAYMIETSFEIFIFTAVSDEEFRSHQHFLEEALRPKGSIPSIMMQKRAGTNLRTEKNPSLPLLFLLPPPSHPPRRARRVPAAPDFSNAAILLPADRELLDTLSGRDLMDFRNFIHSPRANATIFLDNDWIKVSELRDFRSSPAVITPYAEASISEFAQWAGFDATMTSAADVGVMADPRGLLLPP
ncbi:hypothetical protein DFH09DRAFT_1469076 [Mycena vulgaris]|nr:hypothetical protein DFH09DRAFT_1469076 [Mycena vulgaris]